MNSGKYKLKKKKTLFTLRKKNYDDWNSVPSEIPIQENVSVESSSRDWTESSAYPENFSSSDLPPLESPPDEWREKHECSWESPPFEWMQKNECSWESSPDAWRGEHVCSWESPSGEWEAFQSPDEVKNPNSCDWSVKDWSDFSNKVYEVQSEIRQEDNSENGEDLKNKVGDCNLNRETDTIYDTLSNLSSDFLSALQKNSFSDVSIKCGDYVQQVHKFVLAARSPVFEAMFSTAMEESEKGVVAISDIDESVLDDLLAFIYGAQVKNMTESKACDLLYVAEKYQVKGLKDICTNYLRSCLSIPNAIQILQFADLYDEELKKDIMSYVCENFSALKITEEWKTLQKTKPNLSIDVYSMVVEKYEEQGVSRSAENS